MEAGSAIRGRNRLALGLRRFGPIYRRGLSFAGMAGIMEVTLKYFAWVRERIGIAEERVVLPDSVATVHDAILWLKQRGEGYAAAFEREDIIRAAINQMHASHDSSLEGTFEIAFFPPITGG